MPNGATNTVKVLVLGPAREPARALLGALADVQVLAGEPVAFIGREARWVRADFARVELTAELAISLVAVATTGALGDVLGDVEDGLLGALALVDGDDPASVAATRALVDTAVAAGVATFVVLRHGDASAAEPADVGTAEVDLPTTLGLPGAPRLDVDPTSRDDARGAVLALLQETLRARTVPRDPAAVG